MPKVSVIVNCYNGERYLREAIDSVVSQTFRDWELIFWDNASTDSSAQIVHSYRDKRIRYFSAAHTVLGEARRLAMVEARGEWVGFLDVDDIWVPHKLERQMEAVKNREYVLCYAGVREINPEGKPIRDVLPLHPSGDMFSAQLQQFDINMVTPLLRREALVNNCISFDGQITASEEYNLFMRLLARGSACAIPEVLGYLRLAPGTLTSRSMEKWAQERFYTLRQIESENPGIATRFLVPFAKARARGHYYRARWHMASGETRLARNALHEAASISSSYRILSWLTSCPKLWGYIHDDHLKRRLSGLIRRW